MEEKEYIYVKKKIRDLTKIDLDNYGSNQMMRRLDGYISRARAKNVANYVKTLSSNSEELERLRDFLTINVSEFFRDITHFNTLRDKILPGLLRRDKKLNIWCAGCSNGAEAYSMAIILERLTPHGNHRILATDIDENILRRAAAGGPYKPAEVRNAEIFHATKYLTAGEDGYQVTEDLRKSVTFRQHDLTGDAFEGVFDLISCRNVVIYFTDTAKSALKKKFHDSLKMNGVLFIGGTETMLDASETGFQRIAPCFYRKTSDVTVQTKAASAADK